MTDRELDGGLFLQLPARNIVLLTELVSGLERRWEAAVKIWRSVRGAILAVSTVTVAWGGIASASLPEIDLGSRSGKKVSFVTLGKGIFAEYANPSFVAARSACEWIQAMDEIAANGGLSVLPPPGPPQVDWTRRSVVLIALGHMDGFSVEVRDIRRVGLKLYVDMHVTYGEPTGHVDVSPFHLIAVDAKSFDVVVARYDWAPPGVPESARILNCSPGSNLKGLLQDGGDAGGDEVKGQASWGAVKARYR